MQVEDLYVQSIVQLTLITNANEYPVHTHATTLQSHKRATYANCVQCVRDVSLK